ncbi:MAG: M1 family metallopeptidase [Bacteroidetes bacterium]|nr:M1 family metallopeptidase [Bacteroidota bacterium]
MKKTVCLLWLLGISLNCLGKEYFQQHVATTLTVRLDDRLHFLHGFERIVYTNKAPDTLHYLYFHLWPNAYSSDRTTFSEQQVAQGKTDFYFSHAEDRGYMDSLTFEVNGSPVTAISAPGLPDIARIDLPNALAPNASLEITTPFRVKIPKVFSRLGHSKQAYYISQWFPKPAVYDHKGWHPLPYSDQGEFYSEIGSYDVQITLPKNYVVLATGNCLDESENRFLDSLSAVNYKFLEDPKSFSKRWRDSVNRFPQSATEFKTLHFREDNIHDFAWFADKRYIVRKDTVTLPASPESAAHKVTIYTASLPADAYYWKGATDAVKKTISYLSKKVGRYPYNTVKAVEGDMKAGGGMEYPTITVIDRMASRASLHQVLAHEVGHNWFYGILASNERDDAWMDEGINSFYERKITTQLKEETEFSEQLNNALVDVLCLNAGATHTDQALTLSSHEYTKDNYGLDVYYKTAMMLQWLEGYMGKDSFNSAMQDYFDTWKFRHPYPEDFAQVLKQHTTRPLNWFFEGVLRSNNGVDFGLKSARTKGNLSFITVKNNSEFAAPIRIDAYKNGVKTDSIWSLPFQGKTTLTIPENGADFWRIGSEIPDYYGFNNKLRTSGLFRNVSFKIKPGIGLSKKADGGLYLLPAFGYNLYDGMMAGALLHNLSLPQTRLRYALAPLYSFRAKELVGAGSVGYWFYPSSLFQEIIPQLDFKSFHFDSTSRFINSTLRARYIKLAPSVCFVFKNASLLSPISRSLLFKYFAIWENGFDFRLDVQDSLYKPNLRSYEESNYGLVRYKFRNDRTFNPYSYTLEAQLGNTFSKLSAEGQIRIDYNKKNKALQLRAYAGKFISIVNDDIANSRYWLSASYSASNDYLYEGTWIGRSARDGFAARQIAVQEGGNKISTPYYGFPLGRNDDWLLGINLKSDLPFGNLPLRLYLDLSTYSDAKNINPSGDRWLYSGGLEIHALKDVLLFHIPLIMSRDYQDYFDSIFPDKKLANSISFSIQLQNINWLRTTTSGIKYFMN